MELRQIERRFRRGEAIVERGSPAVELFVVREGHVALWRAEFEPPRLLGPGEMFGEVPLILGRPYDFRAAAEEDAQLLALPIPLLNRLVAECPEFAFRLVMQLAARVDADLAEHTSPGLGSAELVDPPDVALEVGRARSDAAREQAELRLVRTLLDQCGSGEPPLPIDGGLRELALAAGIELFDAYHGLQSLLDRGLVRLIDDQLSVADPDELKGLIRS
jgi:CRP-like cAMP-binding protein